MFKITAVALLFLTILIVSREQIPHFSSFIKIAIAIFFFTLTISTAAPLFLLLKNMMNYSSFSEYSIVLLKALGIAMLTQICSDICRDCGENSLSLWVETTGKIEILILSIPLLIRVFETVKELMEI